jgi:hypothetical protein
VHFTGAQCADVGRPDHPRKLREIYAAQELIIWSTAVIATSYTCVFNIDLISIAT